ncbi:MAG: hypothetical protein Q4G68_04320 [Planctomycetia bacterium]|nr:hypothetical protein [Planctomycetia bacterium]
MSELQERSEPGTLRREVYLLLMIIAAGLIFGRIMSVDNVSDRAVQDLRLARIPHELAIKQQKLVKQGCQEEAIRQELRKTAKALLTDAKKERPTLSANDRSRWLTIRALVEPESRTYRYVPVKAAGPVTTEQLRRNCGCSCPQQAVKGNLPEGRYVRQWVPYAIDKAMESSGWDTIDMVKHGLPDEEYSPADPFSGYLYSSKPPLLPTLMAGPYWLLNRVCGLSLREQPYLTARILLVVYNLIPLVLAWYLLSIMIERLGRTNWGRIFAVAFLCFGTFLSTFSVTLNNHVPGVVSVVLAMYGAYVLLVCGDLRRRWFALTGFFGALAVACELPALAIAGVLCLTLLWKYPVRTLGTAIPCGLLVVAAFLGTNYLAHQTIVPAYAMKRDRVERVGETAEQPTKTASLVSGPSYDANDWYIYRFFPGGRVRAAENARLSYWSNRVGIDRGEPSRWTYCLHATVGHHGVFSLTPVWLLSMLGLLLWLVRGSRGQRGYAAIVLGLTLLFFVFYVSRGQDDRNYGGMTCGLRWFFPLVPLWIPALLPVLDHMSRFRWERALALLLLFLSVMSVAYPVWNPWTHPWLYNGLISLGWIQHF